MFLPFPKVIFIVQCLDVHSVRLERWKASCIVTAMCFVLRNFSLRPFFSPFLSILQIPITWSQPTFSFCLLFLLNCNYFMSQRTQRLLGNVIVLLIFHWGLNSSVA